MLKITNQIKRNYWTISKTSIVGYIHSVGMWGIFYKHPYASVSLSRQNPNCTNSFRVSLGHIDSEPEKVRQFIQKCQKFSESKQIIKLDYQIDLIGDPNIGNTAIPFYLTSINELDDDIGDINVITKERKIRKQI